MRSISWFRRVALPSLPLLAVGVMLLCGEAQARDKEWIETKVVNGERVQVLTNTGANEYGNTMRVKNGALTNVQDINIAPKPHYTSSGMNSAAYSNSGATGQWAFASFDSTKRVPRYVNSFSWINGADGLRRRGWLQVDLNEVILRQCRIWRIDPLLVEIVIRHESNFNPEAVSPAGAVGLMQLMPATAAGLGVGDPYDVEQNVAGGVHYLSIQLQRFGSVPCALAAYNAGPGAVEQYGGVPPYAETQYYVDTIYGEYLAGKFQRERNRK